jgi:outer membrane receptor protein involved in Fe transport
MDGDRLNSWPVRAAILLAVSITLAGGTEVFGQTVGASVGGIVTDPSGARLPGVTVTVTNTANGSKQTFVTGPEGNYRAVALQPAPYVISAELQGFTPQTRSVTLTVGADSVVDLSLSLATVQENVTVTGTATAISVAKAELSSVVLPSQVESLPTLGRNFLELAQLLPGSAPDNSRTQYFNPTKFAGVADQRNGFTTVIDGGAVDDTIWGSTVMNFTQEAVQEFKVYRNQFDAEYGGALAAVVSVVSKAGANQLSGSGMYFGRDRALNAQDYFTTTKPPFSQKRLGGSLGGPIVLNKTHFFGAYEYNGIDTVNVIALPATNPFAAVQNGVFPATNNDHMVDGRVDQRFNDHHSFYVRFAYDNQFKLRTQAVSSDSNQIDEYSRSNSAVVNENWIISQNTLNAFHFTFLQQNVGNDPHSFDLNIGRPSAVTGQSTISPQYFPRHTSTIYDTVYLNSANHNIKVGGSLAFATTGFESHFFEHGSFTFTTDVPFDANNAATWPFSFTIRLPGDFVYRSKQVALFLQDDWHVADRVRLNLGLRYDLDTNLRANDFYAGILAAPAFAGLKNFISPDRGTDYKNLQPRLGATWDARGNGTLVMRGAFGMYSTRNRPWFQVNSMSSLLGNNVTIFDSELLRNYPSINAVLGGKTIQDYIAAGGTRAVFLVGDDSVLPTSFNGSGGFGWQLNQRSAIDVDYVHNYGTNQLGGRDLNLPPSGPIGAANARPVGGYSTVTVMQNFSKSWYDALETQFRTRFKHVDNLLVSYTLSRSFRDGVDFFGTPRGTQRTPHEVGYTETDQRHNLAISAATTLPGLIQISGIGKFISGSPLHDQAGVDLDGDGTVTNDRPSGLESSVGRRNVAESLQIINAFRASRGLPPIPASLLELDPFVSVDGRITKVVRVGGNRRLDLFFEGFNLTNHENFTPYSVNVNIVSSSFLVRNGARPARQLQWGARYVF